MTLRDNTERPEPVEAGADALAVAEAGASVRTARAKAARPRGWADPFGDGRSGGRIVAILFAG